VIRPRCSRCGHAEIDWATVPGRGFTTGNACSVDEFRCHFGGFRPVNRRLGLRFGDHLVAGSRVRVVVSGETPAGRRGRARGMVTGRDGVAGRRDSQSVFCSLGSPDSRLRASVASFFSSEFGVARLCPVPGSTQFSAAALWYVAGRVPSLILF